MFSSVSVVETMDSCPQKENFLAYNDKVDQNLESSSIIANKIGSETTTCDRNLETNSTCADALDNERGSVHSGVSYEDNTMVSVESTITSVKEDMSAIHVWDLDKENKMVDTVLSSKSYSELGYLYVELQLPNCNVDNGNLQFETRHIRGVFGDTTGLVDLYGDARTIPPRHVFLSRVVPNSLHILANPSQRQMLHYGLSKAEANEINGSFSHPQLLQKDRLLFIQLSTSQESKMGQVEEQGCRCKICSKHCTSGKSLGGHMRVHYDELDNVSELQQTRCSVVNASMLDNHKQGFLMGQVYAPNVTLEFAATRAQYGPSLVLSLCGNDRWRRAPFPFDVEKRAQEFDLGGSVSLMASFPNLRIQLAQREFGVFVGSDTIQVQYIVHYGVHRTDEFEIVSKWVYGVALRLFYDMLTRMQGDCIAYSFTISSLLIACAGCSSPSTFYGSQIQASAVTMGYRNNLREWEYTVLIALASFGHHSLALSNEMVQRGLCAESELSIDANVFMQSMECGVAPHPHLFNVLLDGHAQMIRVAQVGKLSYVMLDGGVLSHIATYNILVYLLCKIGELAVFTGYFAHMVMLTLIQSTYSYNCVMDDLCATEDLFAATPTHVEMGIYRDVVMYDSFMKGYSGTDSFLNVEDLVKQSRLSTRASLLAMRTSCASMVFTEKIVSISLLGNFSSIITSARFEKPTTDLLGKCLEPSLSGIGSTWTFFEEVSTLRTRCLLKLGELIQSSLQPAQAQPSHMHKLQPAHLRHTTHSVTSPSSNLIRMNPQDYATRLLKPLPTLRLEDKAISMGGGVDRDLPLAVLIPSPIDLPNE